MKTIKVLLLLTGLCISSMVFGSSAPATVLTPEQKEKIDDNKLLAAAKSGVLKRAQTALRRGANIKATDKDGWIALDLAAHNGHVAVVSLLLQSGADINARTNQGQVTFAVFESTFDYGLVLICDGANKPFFFRMEGTGTDLTSRTFFAGEVTVSSTKAPTVGVIHDGHFVVSGADTADNTIYYSGYFFWLTKSF